MPIEALAELTKQQPDVAWEVVQLLPRQGEWGENDYLWFANRTNRLVELVDGVIEVLPMPSPKHQRIALFLYRLLFAFVDSRALGTVLVAPLSVRLWAGRFREPDLVFLFAQHMEREREDCWDGADLIMEVVSPSKPAHDLVTKRSEYAQAGIPEYWIINPETATITVLTVAGDVYVEHGVFQRGDVATSALLTGFEVDVDAALNAR
jgi:Uma2 family endonuclease